MLSVDATPALQSLIQEAINHNAVHHPYLKALAEGNFKNTHLVLQDFAGQYYGYSSWFPKYLTAAISKLNNPIHRHFLLQNLTEESGHLAGGELQAVLGLGIQEEWIQGVPHPVLFRRFVKAMTGAEEPNELDMEVIIWREQFYNLLLHGTPGEAVGAIGLGTEVVVKYIYKYIIKALKNHTKLTLYDRVFFDMHTEVDDEHGKTLLQIASDIIEEGPQQKEELRKGMLKALSLRSSFWDAMYERALKNDKQPVSTFDTRELYNGQAHDWKRDEPLLLSDYSARPFVLDLCEPLKGQHVLDLGCGEGYVSRQLKKRGATTVHGMDISEKMIEAAQKSELTEGLYYSVGDARSISQLPKNSLDLILAMFLFNYLNLEETYQCMKDCYSLLKPGGKFIFSVPHPFLPFMKSSGFPFYFEPHGDYFSARSTIFPGQIWRRDGIPVGVQCVHKTFEDYFQGLANAGFTKMPAVHELRIREDQFAIDPNFFEPLRGLPLHVAFKIIKD